MPDLPESLTELSPAEQRVLGSLLEKELAVPASYPMTLNALRTACNQTSSREPVVDYDEHLVQETVRGLKRRGLARVVWSDTGRRTMKWLQTLTEVLDLGPDQRALLTVLLLRGPQPAGALRSRTERLHRFADREEVEACLRGLGAATPPLVQELERRRGQQDARWVHLLGPVDLDEGAATAGPAGGAGGSGDGDREKVLQDGAQARDERVRAAYDAVAAPYADTLVDELDALPLERWVLQRAADLADRAGALPVVEVGCGPGHVTAHLASLGLEASGIDSSPAMVEQARRRFPDGRYDVGDLRSLMRPATAPGWGAVLAWYSLIHLTPAELPAALAALVRPLAPGGVLVLAAHAGPGVRHVGSWFDVDVDVDVVHHEPVELADLCTAAGLVDVEWYRRGPVLERGESTERCYVIGRRPLDGAQA